jgi:uncharacterized iron-regulated membrane protein
MTKAKIAHLCPRCATPYRVPVTTDLRKTSCAVCGSRLHDAEMGGWVGSAFVAAAGVVLLAVALTGII